MILEQARSYGISATLANQTQSDLNTPDADLRPTVRTNTRTKMFFTVSDPMEMKDLATVSGEEYGLLNTESETPGSAGLGASLTFSATEALKPRLTINDMLSVNDHPLDFILQVSRGSGYTQFAGLPIRTRTSWPLTRQVYDDRAEHQSWPARGYTDDLDEDNTVVNEVDSREVDRQANERAKQQEEERRKAEEGMRQLRLFGEPEEASET